MHLDAGDAEAGHAALPRAEHVAFAAQSQILLGDAEAVIGLAQDRKPRFRRLAERRLVEQEAGRALGAAADAAAQLMELREAEAFGMLDHHHARLGHVDADFDHGGRDQDARRAGGKARHGAVLVRAAHAGRARARRCRRSASAGRGSAPRRRPRSISLGFFDQRAHPVDPPALIERALDRVDHFGQAARAAARGCRSAAGRPASRAARRRPCRRNR